MLNVGRIFADGMPEEGQFTPPDDDQNSTRSDLLDIKQLLKDIDKNLGGLKSSQEKKPKLVDCKVEESKPPEKITELECIGKKVDKLIAKPNENKFLGLDFSDFINILNIIAFGFAWYEIRHALRSNRQQKEAVRKNQAASFLAKQNLEEQKGIIRGNRTRALLNDSSANRAERIGDFPEMYYYIADRIQNTRGPVIIIMPFYLFGILGSPHGLNNFHHTLHELFGVAAGGDDKRRLIVITYDDQNRYELALKRYSHAIHGMETLDDTPQSQKLESIFSEGVWQELLKELEVFRAILDEHPGNREMLEKLAKDQEKFIKDKQKELDQAQQEVLPGGKNPDEAIDMDLAFLDHLRTRPLPKKNYFTRRRSKEISLFEALHNARLAFSKAVKEQEKIYSKTTAQWNGTTTPWTNGATIIKVPRGRLSDKQAFDNQATIYAAGELMHATSSLTPSDNARNNRLMSESGEERIDPFKWNLSILFERAEEREKIPRDIMEELNEALPGIKTIENWLKSEPKV